MANPVTHPSFLELDRAALGEGALDAMLHLESCARCQEHLRTVQAALPLPSWVGALRANRVSVRAPRLQWLLAGGLAVAVVLVAGLRLWPTTTSNARHSPPLIAAKGTPAVALYIKREDRVFLWNGLAPLRVGDRIQLEIASGGFGRIAVVSMGDSPELLYSSAIDAVRPVMLPISFVVDAKPGGERLAVGLSRQELTREALVAAVGAHRRDGSIWTTELVLAKQTSGGVER